MSQHYGLRIKGRKGIRFTFLVLPFWCRLTRVVADKIQEDRKTVVSESVCVIKGV